MALVTTRPLISTNTSFVLQKQGASPVFFREKNMNALLLLAALS
ncbi:curli assembly protein CsgC, partial [Shigella sonnei]|nr:curli assembly protein CsgC [Shigella sonnei]EGE4398462.1 curli assembly protein CsgC [Shigella sonnei]